MSILHITQIFHGSRSQIAASHDSGLSLNPGQSMWYFLGTKWHWNSFSIKYYCSSLSVLFRQYLTLIILSSTITATWS